MKNLITYLCLIILLYACNTENSLTDYETETLKIKQLTEAIFVHTSYLQTSKYGNVACNGMIVIDNDKALGFNTPVDNEVSEELINWVTIAQNCQIEGVIVTHFHVDCLGGLESFHKRKIPSYAKKETISLAHKENSTEPKIGFDEYLELEIGTQKVTNKFFGEGHTSDNIVCYIPKEKVLFGGCLIKSIGARKGNLADASEKD